MNKPDDHQQHRSLNSITKAFLAFWKKKTKQGKLHNTSPLLSFQGGPLDGVTGHPEDLHNGGDILSNGYYCPTKEENVFRWSEAL